MILVTAQEIQKLVDNAYLQGMHEAFIRIGQAHADEISKLDKKVLDGDTLTDDEVAEVRNSSIFTAKLTRLENEMVSDVKKRIAERKSSEKGDHSDDVTNI